MVRRKLAAIVPFLRGYGSTRFLSISSLRNGQPSAVALDAVALMDALSIKKAILAGFDWGARTADIIAALWPERCRALVSVSGYLIGGQESGKTPLPPKAELAWWYQFYFATERGRAGYEKGRSSPRGAHGARQGVVSELTVIAPFAKGGAERLRKPLALTHGNFSAPGQAGVNAAALRRTNSATDVGARPTISRKSSVMRS